MQWNYFQLKTNSCTNQVVNESKMTARFNIQCAVYGVCVFLEYNLGIRRFSVRLPHEKREWANENRIHNPKPAIASNHSECIYLLAIYNLHIYILLHIIIIII